LADCDDNRYRLRQTYPGNHAVSVGAMLFAIVATLVIAHYTYTYIEVPWRRPWSTRADRQAIAAKTA